MKEIFSRNDKDRIALITGEVIMKKVVETGLVVLIEASEKWHDKEFVEVMFYAKTASSLHGLLAEGSGIAVFCRVNARNVKGKALDRFIGLKATVFSGVHKREEKKPLQVVQQAQPDASSALRDKQRNDKPPKKRPYPEDLNIGVIKKMVLSSTSVAPASDDDLLKRINVN